MKEKVLATIIETGIVAIMRGLSREESLKATEALICGGVRAIEMTSNTKGAATILKDLAGEFGSQAFFGAGTVISQEHLDNAIGAGASFILAPNLDPEIVRATVQAGLVAVPGAFTATEALQAHRAGADIIKVFPVSSVGPQYIKDLKAPLDNLAFMPVGGVDLENAGKFIKAGAAALGIGSSLVRRDLIAEKRFDELAALAGAFLEKVREARR